MSFFPTGSALAPRFLVETAVRLGDESLGELTVALSGVRATEHDAWLEGNPAPVDEPVEPSWPTADYEQKMIDTAIGALERVQPSKPARTRPRHAVAP